MTHAQRIVTSFVLVLLVCAAAATGLARLAPRPAPAERVVLGDLSGAARVEILDETGRPILGGPFQAFAADTADVLKAAQLVAEEGAAVGKVEIELVRHSNGVLVQELEIDVDGLPGDAVFTVRIDGGSAGWFRTDSAGGAEFERYGRVAAVAERQLRVPSVHMDDPGAAPMLAVAGNRE